MKLKSKSSSVSRKRPIYISDARVRDCGSRLIYISWLLIKLFALLWSLLLFIVAMELWFTTVLVEIKYAIEPEGYLQSFLIDSWVFSACSYEVENSSYTEFLFFPHIEAGSRFATKGRTNIFKV